jgi:hypothetical protein
MRNPLQDVIDWHIVADDSLRVVQRVLNEKLRGPITSRHVFTKLSTERSLELLDQARLELADLVVLSLVATFERLLRDFVVERTRQLWQGTEPVDARILAAIEDDQEYWRISDRMMGLFAGPVPSELTGQVKQVIGYRNWVAHGRKSSDPPDGNITPQVAYGKLSGFLEAAGVTTGDPNLDPPAAA